MLRSRALSVLSLVLAGCSGGSDSGPDARVFADSANTIDAPTIPIGPANDTCAGAGILTFANGVAAGIARTVGAGDHTAASCGGGGGRDVVFTFTTPAVGTLVIDVRPTQGTARPVLSLRTSCDMSNSEVGGGCVSADSAGAGALMIVRDVAVGTYYLWIDSTDTTEAQFDVSVVLLGATAGDSCASAIGLPFTAGEANVAASSGSTNDENGFCGGSTGLDNVFLFTLASVSNVEVTVTPTTVGTQPVVYLQSTCGGSDTGCAVAGSAGANAFLRLGSMPAGTHYLWVDGANSISGNYELTARATAPALGDTCANAEPLMFTNGVATHPGNTTTLFNDGSGTCASGTAFDSVYMFTTTAVQNVRLEVTTTSGTFQPAVYMRSATCTGTQLGCAIAPAAGGTSSLSFGSLPVGTYYVWVDGVAGTTGPYTLTATLEAPTPGDNCTIAKALTFNAGVATDTGNTSLWFPDTTGTCASGTAPDGVYTFTTTQIQDLRIVVNTSTGTYQPAVYVRSASCTGSQIGCGAAVAAGGSASLEIPTLPIGTYYLWIDGVGGTSGAYTLGATLADPIPGERCTNPAALTFTNDMASATGNTTAMFDDATGTCNSSGAADAVYSFTTTAVKDIQIAVSTSTGTYRPAVYLRSASCTGSQLGCGAAAAVGGTATLNVGGLAIGTYYIWVDGVSGTEGAFSLTASLSDPLPGERCANPEPLTFTNGLAGGTATANGDTAGMIDDSTGTCGGSGSPDKVYTFSTDRPLDLTASVSTTTGTYRPVVYLRSATCTGTQLGCALAPANGGTANLSVQTLPAGTYYLWVDGAAAGGGMFTLDATLTPLPPAEVRPVQPTDVVAPGPMTVVFEVVDRLGFVVTSDNATQFTITATGSAVFTSANTGTIVSGAGTNSVVVQVSGGVISLNATDATPEVVTYNATDSEANGLAYPTGSVTQLSPTQTLVNAGGTNTFNLNFAQRPSADATLTITAFGDLDFSSEYLDVFMESVSGTSYGSVFVTGGGSQCSSTVNANVTIPQADLMTHLSDGVATIVTRSAPEVNFCTGNVAVRLTFPISNSAEFLP